MFKPQGVIPALVTPLDRDGALLTQNLRDLIDFTIANDVDGVFVLGSAGEIYGLSDDQKRQVTEITVEQVNGRVPVYVGASEITTRDCIRTARMAQEVGGVSALSVLTPYFLTPDRSELIDHFTAIAESVDLPILLYDNPGRTHVSLTTSMVLELAQVPGIIGLKDSAGNLSTTADVLRERPEGFSVLMGKDTLIYSALCLGADGAIASTANVAPKLVSAIYRSYVAGDHARSLELQGKLAPLRHLVDTATFPVVLKEGLRMLGVEAGYCLAPTHDLPDPARARLRTVIDDIQSLEL